MAKKEELFKIYLKDIYKTSRAKDSTEGSYYPDLKKFLAALAEELGYKVTVTTNPKKRESNMPDVSIRSKDGGVIGYIEVKNFARNLDGLTPREQEQLKRYRELPNLIFTNLIEFRLYRDGNLTDSVSIVPVSSGESRDRVVRKLKEAFVATSLEEAEFLFSKFFSFVIPETVSAKELALELAKRTRFLRDSILGELEDNSDLQGFLKAFRDHLIPELGEDKFADFYAQTITYGLFAAKVRTTERFNRRLAYRYIPKSLGILRDVFRFVSSAELPYPLESAIDDIAGVLAKSNVQKIMDEFFKRGKGTDPIYHFYETFIKEYDPETRERLGVFYTPAPVVSYITRSINHLLKEKFGKEDGFATTGVTVLDPAAGTMTFPAQAIQLAKEEASKHGSGMWRSVAKDHILKDFYAFELLMAPYAIGHIKMSLLLEDLGYEIPEDKKFNLYLTNTLDPKEVEESKFPLMRELSKESREASKVKREIPIMVIMGNPPYSGISENPSEIVVTIPEGSYYFKRGKRIKATKNTKIKMKTFIGELIEDYKYVNGKHFGERKHWLQDDYVKFIRFAQWKINQAGEGILGFITNHSYLDNPTFRGMRQSLMNSFDEIYILDLHGSSLKKERCPDGSKDENVFDIRQGVAIALFIKKKDKEGCTVYHSEIWGLREAKYNRLIKADIKTIGCEKIRPTSPYYFFVPREEKGREIYEKYWKVTDIFPVNSVGIVTARDKFVIDFDKDVLKRRIAMFRNLSMPDESIKHTFKLRDTSTFKFSKSREALSEDENWDKYFAEVLYRPFDKRNIYYTNVVVERPLFEVMRHMMQENLGIHTCRQISSSLWQHVLATNGITDDCYVSNRTRERGYLFPLYLYHDKDKKDLFSHAKAPEEREKNISPKLLTTLSEVYGKEPTPEETFYYIYAILYSNTYREKYQEFLKIDFPRIPFTKDHKLFQKLAGLGKELVDLHLLKSSELEDPIRGFWGDGEGKVEEIRFDNRSGASYWPDAGEKPKFKSKGFVWINPTQFFWPVPKEIWEYQIGGYQVLNKWLKDRKGRTLSTEDIKHYLKIVIALAKTIEIQKEIDKLYPKVEKKLIYE